MKKPATKIGCYVRISTRDKSQSTKMQRHSIREWATANRIPPNQLRFYEDRLSGAKAERPALNKMLKAVERGSLDTVVVYRLDRLSRSTRHGLEVLAKLADQQVRVVSISEAIDFSAAMGKFVATLMLALSEMEHQLIRSRIIDALAERKAAGVRLGRPRNEARLAKIAKMKAEGWSVVNIADEVGCTCQNVYKALRGSELKKAV